MFSKLSIITYVSRINKSYNVQQVLYSIDNWS